MNKLLKFFLSGAFICLVLLFANIEETFAAEQDVSEMLDQISEKYEVGDILSEEDAEIIKNYANLAKPTQSTLPILTETSEENPITTFGTGTFYNTKTLNGVTATVSGTCKVNHWNPLKNTYDCTNNAKTNKGTVKAIITHTAYGILGIDGSIGKIYSKSFSKSGSGTAYLRNGDDYAGGVVWSTSVLKATATYGNTTVSAWDSY